jgi:UDP-N-acetylmuramyl pentapeptide phosphotransferase/UDP-N-acetylglucosamine-1-phosphate transferase
MIFYWIIAAITTAVLLGLWKKVGIKDVPSHRSSHAAATTTASGICISCVFICFYMGSANFATTVPFNFMLGLSLLTVIGFIDDWRELSYKIRLVSHSLIVGLVLLSQNLSPIEYLVWFFIGVGLINVCNFLDGLNGLLASQWLLTTGFLLASFSNDNSIFWILWISVLIYLLFNFPKSYLFMGDTGSTILGFSYFAIIFYLAPLQNEFPSTLLNKDSFVLFALFPLAFAWGDVTFTLIRRFLEKRSVVSSFGDYGFHHQARFFKSHSLVTLVYLGLNCLLAFGAQSLFLDHKLIPVVCGAYVASQILHFLFIYKISKAQSTVARQSGT